MKNARAQSFWGKDIDQIEKPYLGGLKVTDLPVRALDGRVPAQGSVILDSCVNIDQVVTNPSWFAVAFAKCKLSVLKKHIHLS